MEFTMSNRYKQIESYLKESIRTYDCDKSCLTENPYSLLLTKFNEIHIADSILLKYGFKNVGISRFENNISRHHYHQEYDFTIKVHFQKIEDIFYSCAIPTIEWLSGSHLESTFTKLDTSNDAAFSIYCILIHKGNIKRAFNEFVLGYEVLIELCKKYKMDIDCSLCSDNNSLFPFPLRSQNKLNEEVSNLQNQVATLESKTIQLERKVHSELQRNLIGANYQHYSPTVFSPMFDSYPSDAFGSAEWMNYQDCINKGFFDNASSIPLGLMDNSKDFDTIYYQDERHLITIAPSGTGKNAAVQIPVLLEYKGSVLIIDPKGESAAITARHRKQHLKQEVYILNPFDELSEHFDGIGDRIDDFTAFQSKGFNPLARLNHENDNFVADVAFLCEALIETEGNDPYWSNSARELIACLVMYVCVTEDEHSPNRNLVEVRRLLTQSEKDLLNFLSDIAGVSDYANHKKDVADTENNATDFDDNDELPELFSTTDEELASVDDEYLSKIEKARDFRPIIQKANFFVGSSGSIPSVIAVARTQTNFLDDKKIAENLSRNDIDFLDMKTKKITVYIILPIRYLVAYSRWFRLLINSALNAMMSTHKKGDKNVLFMLDECAILGELSCLQTAVGLARGYGIQLWTFWQDIHQLHDIYKTRAQSFLANVGVQQYFTPNDMLSSEVISKRMGDKTIITRQRNINDKGHQSVSYSESGVPLVRENEMLELSNSYQILFFAGNKRPLTALKNFYYEYDDFYLTKCDKNPYYCESK